MHECTSRQWQTQPITPGPCANPSIYRSGLPIISLTVDLANKAGGQRGIIELHKYDETPCPCDPEPAVAEPAKTKKAPDC